MRVLKKLTTVNVLLFETAKYSGNFADIRVVISFHHVIPI